MNRINVCVPTVYLRRWWLASAGFGATQQPAGRFYYDFTTCFCYYLFSMFYYVFDLYVTTSCYY